ncbi:hypothetical protein, partial [Vibrio metschnikovii]|uniref:hypothetical protein n=3 Tax=Vibrio metschnikovii TaxID=28172 RepID=UPI001C304F56
NTVSKQDVNEIPDMLKRNSLWHQRANNTKERDFPATVESFAYTIYQSKTRQKHTSLDQLSIATKKNNKLIISIN